jgi:hypothetical protein
VNPVQEWKPVASTTEVATELTLQRDLELRAALENACALAGLAGHNAERLKSNNNVVYRLAADPVVVRMGIGAIGEVRATRIVAAARSLSDQGAPDYGGD